MLLVVALVDAMRTMDMAVFCVRFKAVPRSAGLSIRYVMASMMTLMMTMIVTLGDLMTR